MKNICKMGMLALLTACTQPQSKQLQGYYPIEDVKLNRVELTDSFWLPRIQMIQNVTIPHAFQKCIDEGRLENFVTAGKVMQGERGVTRGKMPFDDTDLYKVIEGAALSLINLPNKKLDAYLDSVIGIIKQGQEPDGYLTTWRTIDPMTPPCMWFEGGPRWSRLDISHELYNSGHLFEAASAHYWATGKRNFLDIALKNADLLVKVFSEGGLNEIPGHQIVETGLIKLYQITGKEAYLKLSKRFLDLRGDATQRVLWTADNIQDHLPILEQNEVNGHAVRAVYMYAGMTDIAAIYSDSAYRSAIDTLWENMVDKKMYITGGIGAHHHGECFGENYELPNLTAYSETCAAIGSVCWNERMFRLTGNADYFHIVERTLYNALIAGISLEGTKYFYPNPMECDGEFKFNKEVSCTREPWFDCSCCPTNLIRFIPYVPGLIYATAENTLYVNLYMANQASIELADNSVQIHQQTDYPRDGKVAITLHPESTTAFEVKVRIPYWMTSEAVPSTLYSYSCSTDSAWSVSSSEATEAILPSTPSYTVTVNDAIVQAKEKDGYISLERNWEAGDVILLDFPMEVRLVTANEKVENLEGKTALEYGPFVYCAEAIDNGANFEQIRIGSNDTYSVAYQPQLLGGVNVLTQTSADKEVEFIPYYAWANRGITKMKVWMENQ